MTKTHIYKGDSNGGPIDYGTPIGDVAGLQFTFPGLPAGSVTRFGVRNYDDATGLEETNIDAVTTVIVDASGANVSDVPGAPSAVSARPAGPTSVTVAWQYLPDPSRPDPMTFNIYMSIGNVVDWTAAPAASVPFVAGARDFRHVATGLQSGTAYAFGVRSARGAALSPPTSSVAMPPIPAPPSNVLDLTGQTTFVED
jgi:hypothetical protein